jgi:hypothetical protein
MVITPSKDMQETQTFLVLRLLDSDKANKYLDEHLYEAILFFPRARAARRKDPLLPSNVSVYINSTTLPPDLVTSLVSKAGGQVTSSLQEADIILSNTPMNLTAITVTENWLLDSIEHWRCKWCGIQKNCTHLFYFS